LPMASRKMHCKHKFIAKIMFTDVAGFTRDGIGNFRNTHVWMDDNPHTTVASRHQHRFSINVWVRILDDHLSWTRCLT
jgi:hypothetical protein